MWLKFSGDICDTVVNMDNVVEVRLYDRYAEIWTIVQDSGPHIIKISNKDSLDLLWNWAEAIEEVG